MGSFCHRIGLKFTFLLKTDKLQRYSVKFSKNIGFKCKKLIQYLIHLNTKQ